MIIAVISTIVFYVTLILELTIWHVPSVASTVKIFGAEDSVISEYSEEFKWVFESSKLKKIILFALPLIFIYILHFYPVNILYDYINGETDSSALQCIIGSGLVLLGRVLSIIYLFKIRQKNDQKGDESNLHTDGIFKYSRNPGLISMYISFVGFGIIINSLLFVICMCVYVVHMHFKVLMEEDFLKSKFGIVYSNYINNSKRYLWF